MAQPNQGLNNHNRDLVLVWQSQKFVTPKHSFFIRPSSNPPEGFASDPVTIGQAPVRSGPPTPCSPRVGAVAYPLSSGRADGSAAAFRSGRRSEERRVGKACRSGTPPKHVR